MVRKIITLCIVATIVTGALCAPTSAATHNVYTEGNISTTYVQYFKDILAGANVSDDYVAFRSGQYSYTMVVGDLDYNNGSFTLIDDGTVYEFTQSSNYNSQYKYNTEDLTNFSVSVGDNIIYSNLGAYPHLIERGAHIETLTLVVISAVCLFVLVDRIFRHC